MVGLKTFYNFVSTGIAFRVSIFSPATYCCAAIWESSALELTESISFSIGNSTCWVVSPENCELGDVAMPSLVLKKTCILAQRVILSFYFRQYLVLVPDPHFVRSDGFIFSEREFLINRTQRGKRTLKCLLSHEFENSNFPVKTWRWKTLV